MAQTFATLLFLLATCMAVGVIVAGLVDNWTPMMRALGFGGRRRLAPLPPKVRLVAPHQTAVVRFTRRPDVLRVAA